MRNNSIVQGVRKVVVQTLGLSHYWSHEEGRVRSDMRRIFQSFPESIKWNIVGLCPTDAARSSSLEVSRRKYESFAARSCLNT